MFGMYWKLYRENTQLRKDLQGNLERGRKNLQMYLECTKSQHESIEILKTQLRQVEGILQAMTGSVVTFTDDKILITRPEATGHNIVYFPKQSFSIKKQNA